MHAVPTVIRTDHRNGEDVQLCTGDNNTCNRRAKIGELCPFHYEEVRAKTRVISAVFLDADNDRCRMTTSKTPYPMKLCKGDNDTCYNFAKKSSSLCRAHQVGGMLRARDNTWQVGEIRMCADGRRRMYDGHQRVIMCNAVDAHGNPCLQKKIYQGFCKLHSERYQCKFTGEKCIKLSVNGTQYCTSHANNIQNDRERSYGEIAVANALEKLGVVFEREYRILTNDGIIHRLDFYIPSLQIAIEFDGKQHFTSMQYWGGKKGFFKRVRADMLKDYYCVENGIKLLRIPYIYESRIFDCVQEFLEELCDTYEEFAIYSPSKIYIDCMERVWYKRITLDI